MGVANVDSSQSWVSSTTEDSGFTSSRVLLYRMNWQLWKWKLKNPRAQKFWIHHHGWRMKKDQKLNSRNLTLGDRKEARNMETELWLGIWIPIVLVGPSGPLFNVKTKRREGTRTGVGLTRKKKCNQMELTFQHQDSFFPFQLFPAYFVPDRITEGRECITEWYRLSLSNMTHYETKIRRGQHVLLQDYLVEIIDVKPLKESQKIFSQ